MKKNIQPRLDDNYASQSWARGDKLYASDLTKMSRQVDSNENELVELTTNVIPKIAAEIADHQSTLDQFAPKIAKIDVPEGSTIVGEIDKAVADLVNGAPETLDTIKEVADAIEENGDAITALNEIVATNKGAIDAVQAAHQATADKLDKLDQVAVKYSEFTHGDDPTVRHTIRLKNYDNITGVTTTGLGANLAMVSKWDVADFGSAIIPANINAKDGKVTINDSHQIATVDQIPDVSKFETIENVKSSLQALDQKIQANTETSSQQLNAVKEQINSKIDQTKTELIDQIDTKQDAGDYVTTATFDQHVEQYQADKPSFAVKAIVDQALTLKADKEEIERQLAGKAESVHTHAISEITGLNDALNAKVDVDTYTSDKATFALKTDLEPLATKQSVKQQIDAAVTSVYRYKGSVATADQLPKQDQVTGDVYNVESDGANVAWDGEKWDKLGGPIDLSSYATTAAVDEKITAAKNELQPKIDHHGEEIARVEGKVDSHNAVFIKYQQTVDGKLAQEVKDREGAVADIAGKLTTHEQAFETFKTANTEAITAECAKVCGEFAAADTQLQEQLTAKIDVKLAAADFESFKTETYEPKVAELTKSIGDETAARQGAITETTNAFKAADEKVTGEYTKAIEAAKTEVTTKVTEVEGAFNAYKGSNDAAVAKVKTDVTEAFGAADQALETKVTQGYTAAVEGEKAAREAAVALLATKVELEGVNATLTGKFGDYYTKGEVDGKLASIYRFKGSVAAEDQLPKQDQVIGDVYNVEDTGMNVAWDGKKWDKLGSVINLTPYATTESVEAKITETKQAASEALNQHAQSAETTYAKKAEVTKQIEAVDGKFAGKADKVHTHTIENITGLQDALDGKQTVGDYALKSEVKTVDDKFAGYTTTESLNGLLDGKAAVVHTHTVDNVTGLQAALDAKMAASEAAKFAAHDHNHNQAYLAIKGKAESAKVADSVAWANVTGTEAIAVKSEVEAVDAKFASYTTTEALAAEYASKQALTDGLKAKAEAAHTHVAADITDLQDKLDAKLDVGGKAESAKVADSVAWTGVTGTEGVALKSEVTALESKKANTDWANKTFATKVELGGYQAKGEYALKSDLDSKMEASEASKFAQASHVHTIENVTGLQQALNDKIAVVDADGKYALKSAIDGLATKEELNGKAAASHTHQEGEVEGLTAKLATFALKSEIAGFVTNEALQRDYTNTADLGQLLDGKLDTTAGDKKYATKTELNGYQPKGDYVAKTEVNSIVEAAVKAPVFVNIPLRPEPNYTEAAIANWFGCETIEQVGQVITGDKVVYLHFTSTGKDYKIPVQYCAFKADGSNDIILMTVGLDTANDEVCKYKITIALNSDSSTVDVNKTPLVSPAA